MPQITEVQLRTGLKEWLRGRLNEPGTLLVEEFNVERGAARIDVALIADDLEAFEIKSDLDNFTRLSSQIHIYNRVFDRLWIVTGPLYAETVIRIVPRWWGVLAAQPADGPATELVEVRSAGENPYQEALSLAALLWRTEALALVHAMGLGPVPTRATRVQLSERLASEVDMGSLRPLVAEAIRRRHTFTVDLS